MRKFTLNIFTLSLGLAVMPMVEAAPTAQQQLLEQVRLGEATHREDLVQQSLYRLELIDPNNPDVVAARFRSLLRQGDIDGAQKQLDRLSQLAPSSNAYKSSRTTMLLSTPDGRQALQQARLQATTGHAEEAVASYNKLFNGAPPEGDMKETEHTGLPLIYQLVTLIHIVLSRPIWSYFMGNIWTTQQLD